MVKFKLDGKEVEAEEGATILKVACEHGIDIPTLCYHPAMEPYQVCRICLVEVTKDGVTRFVPSCGHKVEEGIEVVTGVNLPMLLKLAHSREDQKVEELARIVKDYGRRSISLASEILNEEVSE